MTFPDVPCWTYFVPVRRTRADYKRPIGIFSNSIQLRNRLSLGSPFLEEVRDRLVNRGPLPLRCCCSCEHTPLLGSQKTTRFALLPRLVLVLTSGIPVFTTLCWKGVSFPLGLGIRLISLLWAFLHSSLRRLLRLHHLCAPFYEAWKAGTLTRSMLADVTTSGYLVCLFRSFLWYFRLLALL